MHETRLPDLGRRYLKLVQTMAKLAVQYIYVHVQTVCLLADGGRLPVSFKCSRYRVVRSYMITRALEGETKRRSITKPYDYNIDRNGILKYMYPQRGPI